MLLGFYRPSSRFASHFGIPLQMPAGRLEGGARTPAAVTTAAGAGAAWTQQAPLPRPAPTPPSSLTGGIAPGALPP